MRALYYKGGTDCLESLPTHGIPGAETRKETGGVSAQLARLKQHMYIAGASKHLRALGTKIGLGSWSDAHITALEQQLTGIAPSVSSVVEALSAFKHTVVESMEAARPLLQRRQRTARSLLASMLCICVCWVTCDCLSWRCRCLSWTCPADCMQR